VDNDEIRYTRDTLAQWKQGAEQEALREVESSTRASELPFPPINQRFGIATHLGTHERINAVHCERRGRPSVPDWLSANPERMSSDWLVKRLLTGAEL
jgi:hypothetical protein